MNTIHIYIHCPIYSIYICIYVYIHIYIYMKSRPHHDIHFSICTYGPSMFRLAGGETWLDGLVLLDPATGEMNYGAVVFVNRRACARPCAIHMHNDNNNSSSNNKSNNSSNDNDDDDDDDNIS